MAKRELDLNLTEMRAKATADLIAAIRAAIKQFDDIDALERLMQRASSSDIREPQKQTTTKAAPARVNAAHKRYAKRTDTTRLQEAAVNIVAKARDGIKLDAVLERIQPMGIFDEHITRASAIDTLRDALKDAAVRGDIRAERKIGAGGGYTFFPATSPATSRSSSSNGNSFGRTGVTSRLRKLITDTLILNGARALSPSDLRSTALNNGFSEKIGSDRLSNYLNRILRDMADAHLLKRHGKPGRGVRYSLHRPAVEVTKSE